MPYNLKSISNNNILNQLEKYMLYSDLIENIINNDIYFKDNNKELKKDKKDEKDKKDKIEKIKTKEDYININQNDKKFWFFYMFINDLEICDLPPNHERFKVETETKIKLVEELEKLESSELKQYKISKKKCTLSISDIKNKISLDDLIALCILYKRNLIYVYDDMYYEIGSGLTSNNNKWDIIIKDENNNEKIPNENKKQELLNKIRNDYYKITDLSKGIKSISSYTLPELQELAKKVNISIQKDNKNKLKKDLYDDIYNKINKFK